MENLSKEIDYLISLYESEYSNATSPSPRFYKIGWSESYKTQSLCIKNAKSKSLLIVGDSIANRLYQNCLNNLNPYNVINFGIGGDQTQHVI